MIFNSLHDAGRPDHETASQAFRLRDYISERTIVIKLLILPIVLLRKPGADHNVAGARRAETGIVFEVQIHAGNL